MAEEQPTEEFNPHTPGYIKEMTPAERVEHMTEIGVKGTEASAISRQKPSEASRERDEEIRLKLAAITVEKGGVSFSATPPQAQSSRTTPGNSP